MAKEPFLKGINIGPTLPSTGYPKLAGINVKGEKISVAGLVGYWKLDETSGTSAADATGYGNTGTYVGSPTLNVAPPAALTFPSSAVTFNGSSQYVAKNGWFSLNSYSSGSVSLWYKSTTQPAMGQIFCARDGLTNTRVYINLNSSGYPYFLIGDGTNIITDSVNTFGAWHNAVLTWSSGNFSGYVDGTLVNSSTYTTNAGSGVKYLNLAASWSGAVASDFFNGSIDDVRIYNRALTATEISNLANGGLQPIMGAWSVVGQSIIKGGSIQ